ncbi:PP2C family protein-serine/threonine phosphatase [Streptomyces virginiae]|uniref:PP2C family protein-serine/threonine phosphatase n=1 Tax=Streptomyces virginiae TaxID=1961 RepID=UPI0037A94373
MGDITGHDIHAATIMGQIRSMLRQATLDHPPYSPATALTALDTACSILPLEASGTLVHARLDLADGGPGWTLTWSNAGHPPPLLRTPGGRVALLEEHDILLHRDLGPFHRTATPSQTWRTTTNGSTGTERLTSAGLTVLYTALAGTGCAFGAMNVWAAGMAPTHGLAMLSGVLPAAFSTGSPLRR